MTAVRQAQRFWPIALMAVVVVCAAIGYLFVIRFETTAGAAATAPSHWPEASQIPCPPGTARLVAFVHPQCACTRATIEELAAVVTQAKMLVDLHIVFYRPGGFDQQWSRSDLWQTAAAIPGAQLLEDVDGLEASRFGVRTSGQILFYDEDGVLLLTTGLTPRRGQRGENPGSRALAALLVCQSATTRGTAVFGCPLSNNAGLPSSPGSSP